MGIFRPIFSVNGSSVELATIELFDEAGARSTPPGFDDVLREPFLADADGDGIGERVRPGRVVQVKCKAKWGRDEEQEQDQVGDDAGSRLTLTLYADDLLERGLLDANGTPALRQNDRLLRLSMNDGTDDVRFEAARAGREGLFCVEVRHAETGSGVLCAEFENRKVTG